MELQITSPEHWLHLPKPGPKRAAAACKTGFRRAVTRLGRSVETGLASLRLLSELRQAHEAAIARAGHAAEADAVTRRLGALLHEMIERTTGTGDPLPFNAAVADLSEVVRRAVLLAGPAAETRGAEIRTDLLAPLAVPCDPRLLAEALASLLAVVVRDAGVGEAIHCRASLGRNGEHVEIRITHFRATSRRPGSTATIAALPLAISPDASLETWLACAIVTRHRGTVTAEAGAAERPADIVVSLPGGFL